jgi:hypothetical protein
LISTLHHPSVLLTIVVRPALTSDVRKARDKMGRTSLLANGECERAEPVEYEFWFPSHVSELGECEAKKVVPQEQKDVPAPKSPVEAETVPNEIEAPEKGRWSIAETS